MDAPQRNATQRNATQFNRGAAVSHSPPSLESTATASEPATNCPPPSPLLAASHLHLCIPLCPLRIAWHAIDHALFTMQRMQRITGRFLTRTPNEADVEAMLKDFDDSKVMLEKVRLL